MIGFLSGITFFRQVCAMTDEEGVAFLKEHGWSEAEAEIEVAEYHELPESIREYLPLNAHLEFLLMMTYADIYPLKE